MSKAIVVCKEMFLARRYAIIAEESNEKGYFIKGRTPQRRHVWACILPMEGKVNIEMLKAYYAYFESHHIKHIILIYNDGMTPSVKKAIHDLQVHIELFEHRELTYNILKHELVPKHVVVAHDPHNTHKLPYLRRCDPVARFLAFRVGDIVKIERSDGSVYFRYVK